MSETELERRKSATIVMVDDEPTTLDVVEMLLRDEGYERIVPVTDSTQALGVIERERPDVLLLDLMMPEVGGLDILRAMRASEALERIPVVILTSSSDPEAKLEALGLGATDFLGKPVDPSELILRLRNTLSAKSYLDRLVYADELTGLPNRRDFIERVDLVLRRSRLDGSACALLRVDVDRFKQINDALGHGFGDRLLKTAADRLAKCVQAASTGQQPALLARVVGDEFALLIEGPDPVNTASRTAEIVLATLAEPFVFGGKEFFASCSIGIALAPDNGNDVESLLASAGMALSQAKRGGGNALGFYDDSLNARSRQRLVLENQLRKALDRGTLELHYQPKLDVETGRIVGAEALARWQDSELGYVTPDRFIPIAEETGLIEPLGEWALHAALRQCKAWQEESTSPLSVAVNVSGKQFRSGDFVSRVRRALDEHGVDPTRVVLELTEGTIMEDPEEAAEMLRAIKELGIQISIDDFGTGYSSLSALKRFAPDELKIDRSFVLGLPADPDAAAIVKAVIAMSKGLGLEVVAEGVETEEQLDFLSRLGCDRYQGFLCSKAIPASEWPALLAASQPREFSGK
ncbi:MAG: EAL domain-containing protein [Myxococcota bacterium]|nr:EAL domain-containing protein [Myxococcota bacterium]